MTAVVTRSTRVRRVVLWTLVVAHVVALWAYTIHERQSRYLALALEAREQWGNGQLDAAARMYRSYATDYPQFSWPVVLVRSFPTRARAWYSLGRVEAQRGNSDAALAAYSEAMREERGLGQREYRNLLLELGRYPALAASAHARLAADPDDLAAWWDLGAAYLGAGDAANAADSYAAALGHVARWLDLHTRAGHGHGLSGEEADLRGLLSVAALEAGEPARARAACDELSARQRPEDHYDQLCRAYLAAAGGDLATAAARIARYQPPAPEHERLAAMLRDRLAQPDGVAR